jgi:hypothetical protein
MRLIRDWLRNAHVILAEDVLAEMRKFVITVNNSEFLDEVVLEVVQGIHEKVCTHILLRRQNLNKTLRHP